MKIDHPTTTPQTEIATAMDLSSIEFRLEQFSTAAAQVLRLIDHVPLFRAPHSHHQDDP
jgi:hypothetical protein